VVLVLGDVWEEAWGLVGDWLGNEWCWLGEVDLGWSSVVEVVVPVSGCWVPDWLLDQLDVTSVVLLTSDIVVLEVLSIVLNVVLVVDLLEVSTWGLLMVGWLGSVHWGVVCLGHLMVGLDASMVGLCWCGEGWVVVGLVNVDGAGDSSEAKSGSE